MYPCFVLSIRLAPWEVVRHAVVDQPADELAKYEPHRLRPLPAFSGRSASALCQSSASRPSSSSIVSSSHGRPRHPTLAEERAHEQDEHEHDAGDQHQRHEVAEEARATTETERDLAEQIAI